MGVSGCGKSTVAKIIAKKHSLTYLDADDFHSITAKQHMSSGQPLTNEMRKPWINAIRLALDSQLALGNGIALAFSGLQRQHRDQIRRVSERILFIHLHGRHATIAQRMKYRDNHFMPCQLLESQFEALETTANEADIESINVDQSLDSVIQRATEVIKLRC